MIEITTPSGSFFQANLRLISLIVSLLVAVALAQRSPYAGVRPSGYKDRFRPTAAAGENEIGNRFCSETNQAVPASGNLVAAGNAPATSTQRLPLQFLHDREGFDIYNHYPVDRQPFWLLNYQTIEAQRDRRN